METQEVFQNLKIDKTLCISQKATALQIRVVLALFCLWAKYLRNSLSRDLKIEHVSFLYFWRFQVDKSLNRNLTAIRFATSNRSIQSCAPLWNSSMGTPRLLTSNGGVMSEPRCHARIRIVIFSVIHERKYIVLAFFESRYLVVHCIKKWSFENASFRTKSSSKWIFWHSAQYSFTLN